MIHLDMNNMGDRHLVIAYTIILTAQFGYAAWILWKLRSTKP